MARKNFHPYRTVKDSIIKGILLKISKLLSDKERRVFCKILLQQIKSEAYEEWLHNWHWDNVAGFWETTFVPVRPSKGDIEIYGDLLRKKRGKKRILILGSTPELRDLAAEETDATVYVADFSFRMFFAMLKFIHRADPSKEVWVKANWLDLPFPKEYFDVILGDLVLRQFPITEEAVFLKKMLFLLREGGVFIGRFQFLDKSFYNLDNLEKMVQKTCTEELDRQKRFNLLKLRILWSCADLKSRRFDRKLSAEKLAEYIRERHVQDPLLNEVLQSIASEADSFRFWSPPDEQELTRILSQNFTFGDADIASDYGDARYFPVISLYKASRDRE